ncbi:MAG: hypothetical protein ABEI52_09890, partial [Halobacteriaceae archaeon]
LVLPPIIILSYGSMMSAFPEMPGMSGSPETVGATAGTLFVAAFLPAVIGLFQVISARRADERLTLAGFPREVLFLSRLLSVLVASLLTAIVSMSVLLVRVDVEAILSGGLVLVFVGVLYGCIGMLIGAILPRELEGSLVLIFLVDMDEALASGVMQTDSDFTKLFPLHYPHDLFQASVEGSRIATTDFVLTLIYGVFVLVATLIVYTEIAGTGGDRNG